MPKQFRIIGHSHTAFSDDAFRVHLADGLKQFAGFKYDDGEWRSFADHLSYHQGAYDVLADFEGLGTVLAEGEGGACNRLYYMATPPGLFTSIIDLLGETKQLDEHKGWRRVVIEKPFGIDLASALNLNRHIHWEKRRCRISW
jgi:glucose-6-phosphate 1-dehydrogenase